MLKRSILLLLLAALCAPAQARVDQVSYHKNGVYAGKIGTYELGGAPYLDAGQAAKLLGGKVYWYPVSGKLLLQVKGKKVVFYMKSDSILIGDESVEFPNPLIVRGGKAFISLNFFVSKHFETAFGFRLAYDQAKAALAAEREVNVTSVNFFTHPDKTRIVVYLGGPLKWQASRRENDLFKVTIFDGVLSREEKLAVGDGVLRGVEMHQENKTAVLVLDPDDNFGKADVFTLAGPDRLVIDVSRRASGVRQTISAAPAADEPAVIQPGSGAQASGGAGAAAAAAGAAGAAAAGSGAAAGQAAGGEKMETVARKRIVVDAGHGGKDPGGRKLFGLKEKELNLAVAKELYDLLKGEDIFDVMMTRSTDEFVALSDRSVIANNFKADIFISIHANANRDRREKGFEIYFMSEKASDPWAAEVADFENSVVGLEDGGGQSDPAAMLLHSMARNEYLNEGSRLAGLVTIEMEKRTPFVNRGVKQAAFYVLRGTYAPGILVEMGFMTNSSDQKHMNDKKVRAKIANSIYRGVVKYAEEKGWK